MPFTSDCKWLTRLVCSTAPVLQLTYLNIQGCARACSPSALNSLSVLTSLRQLVARYCQLQQSAVAALAHLTQLQVCPCWPALLCAKQHNHVLIIAYNMCFHRCCTLLTTRHCRRSTY